MEEKKPPQRRLSHKEYTEKLLNYLDLWQREGDTPEEAIGKLSQKQYDFLIDQDVNLDNLILSEKQQRAIKDITKVRRPKGLSYNKKYPQNKQDLYSSIVAHLESQGAGEIITNKNFRDLEFDISGVKFKIVLSNPRPPKN